MFNLGLPEIILIGTAALLVFGPKRLPELAKSLGKGIRDFKKALEGGGAEEDKSTASLVHGEPLLNPEAIAARDAAHLKTKT